MSNSKIDRLWDLVFELSDDDSIEGNIYYQDINTFKTPGCKRVTIDGVRYEVKVSLVLNYPVVEDLDE